MSITIIEDSARALLSGETSRRGGGLSNAVFVAAASRADVVTHLNAMIAATTSSLARAHLLILSSHGNPGTGTSLRFGSDDITPYDPPIWPLVRRIPPNTIVFLNSCWGGYPTWASAVSRPLETAPLFIGPIVKVKNQDSLTLQNELVEIINDSAPRKLRRAGYLHIKYNRKLRGRYNDEAPFRRVSRSGGWSPGPELSYAGNPVEGWFKVFTRGVNQTQFGGQSIVTSTLEIQANDGTVYPVNGMANIEIILDRCQRSNGLPIAMKFKVSQSGTLMEIIEIDNESMRNNHEKGRVRRIR